MKHPTARQIEILLFVCGYIIEKQIPPTKREIADHFGFWTKGASDHLDCLQRKGLIEKQSIHSARNIRITDYGWKVFSETLHDCGILKGQLYERVDKGYSKLIIQG